VQFCGALRAVQEAGMVSSVGARYGSSVRMRVRAYMRSPASGACRSTSALQKGRCGCLGSVKGAQKFTGAEVQVLKGAARRERATGNRARALCCSLTPCADAWKAILYR